MKLTKTNNIVVIGNRPAHLCRLSTLLNRFGIPGEPQRDNNVPTQFSKHSQRSLWDVWELVRARWKHLCRILHPDVGGKAKEFAKMSAIHDVILFRLKKRGVG